VGHRDQPRPRVHGVLVVLAGLAPVAEDYGTKDHAHDWQSARCAPLSGVPPTGPPPRVADRAPRGPRKPHRGHRPPATPLPARTCAPPTGRPTRPPAGPGSAPACQIAPPDGAPRPAPAVSGDRRPV